MDVSGFGLTGTVAAFAVERPTPLPTPQDLRGLVSDGEFAGDRPLIIGGTSGLGAVTSCMLAAGGAEPIVTWHRSKPAADETAAALSAIGACFRMVQLDVSAPDAGLGALADSGWNGHQLYYFASPRIFRRRLEPYQREDLQDFLRVYVDGFYRIVRALMESRPGATLSALYPSTAASAQQTSDLFEYQVAKMAGEELCARLMQRYPALRIIVCRLPRAATRQTSTFLRLAAETPERILQPILKEMHARAAGA
jgi:NAD(P)-dependent dehydrogenase (short-subunit alcohol dehydrogenase family)